MVAICDLRSVSLIVPTLLQATQLQFALARGYIIAALLNIYYVNEFVCIQFPLFITVS